MNCVWTLLAWGFGSRHLVKNQRVCDALHNLRQVKDRLQRRCALLNRKVLDEERDIVELNWQRKRDQTPSHPLWLKLKRHMAMRKMYIQGVARLENATLLLDRQILVLEEAGFQYETIEALRTANVVGDEQRKLIESKDLDSLLDQMEENRAFLDEISTMIAVDGIKGWDQASDEEIAQELEALMDEEHLEAKLLGAPVVDDGDCPPSLAAAAAAAGNNNDTEDQRAMQRMLEAM